MIALVFVNNKLFGFAILAGTAEEFDAYFEDNDVADLLDTKTRRVNIDFPPPVLRRLDLKAHQLGMTRQALVKYWIAERLELVPKPGWQTGSLLFCIGVTA